MRWLIIIMAILLGVIVIVGPLMLMPSTALTITPSPTIVPTETIVVTIVPMPTATPSGLTNVMVVDAWALNVRACPGVGCAVISTLRHGDVVTMTTHERPVILEDGAVWRHVDTGSGALGWVNSKYLSGIGGKNERK